MSATRDLSPLLEESGWIHALARRLVADPALAEDLAQDACVQALEREPEARGSLRAWLATVLRRRLLRVRRTDAHRAAREQQRRADAEPGPAEVVERAESHKNVVLAVLALGEPYRSTLLLRFFEQLSYDEIARRTGVTSGTVNSRVTRGLSELRQRLETTYGDRRALGLALIPLARLPLTELALPTATGWKTMTLWIGSAAAGVCVTTLAVAVFRGGTRAADAGEPLTAPALEELALSQELVSDGAPREATGLRLPIETAQTPAQAHDQRWETDLSDVLVLAPSVTSFELSTGAGRIELRPSSNGRIEIATHVSASLAKTAAAKRTQSFEDHVEVLEVKGALRIRDRHQGEEGWGVDLVVSIPKDLPVRAASGAGDVLLRAGARQVEATSGAGNVRVELPERALESVAVNSGAGEAALAVGSIETRAKVSSGAGRAALLVTDPSSPGTAELSSGAGEVLLVVPANLVGQLDLEAFGTVTLPPSFGLEVTQDVSGRSRVSGRLGGGGGAYRLSTGAGSAAVVIGSTLPEAKPAAKGHEHTPHGH